MWSEGQLSGERTRTKGKKAYYHNQGIGKRLLNHALIFCHDLGFKKVYLWTFEGLNPARHIYGAAAKTQDAAAEVRIQFCLWLG